MLAELHFQKVPPDCEKVYTVEATQSMTFCDGRLRP